MSDLSPLSLASQSYQNNSRVQLLVLSNGHGEDLIAVRIIQELQKLPYPPNIVALPLVGEGNAYRKLEIPLIGAVRTMPSGGFVYMDSRQLMRDMRGGLLQLTWSQIKSIRSWVNSQKKSRNRKAILAVGDIVPLLFAWLSGVNYAFVGTAKSEYHVRDEQGILTRKNQAAAYWENFSGSVYHPWERWLMSRHRCRAVFARDSLTTEILQKWPIPAFDFGNPMMDGLMPTFPTQRFYSAQIEQQELVRPLIVTLLPGSRAPEAYANWHLIMMAVSALMALFQERGFAGHTSRIIVFLAAIAPSLHIENMSSTLPSQGWQPHLEVPIPLSAPGAGLFKQKNFYLIFAQNAYNDFLHLGDLAIAMAGTATEQFVGLGKPAIVFPGGGPQFTPAFAEAQSRLLGPSVILVKEPQDVAEAVRSLLANPDRLHIIAENGVRRMGKPGAAERIANCLSQRL